MRDFIDFVKYIVKDGYQEVYEEDIGDEQIYRHYNGRDPSSRDAFMLVHFNTARRVDVPGKHFTVQHKVRLVKYLKKGKLNDNKKETGNIDSNQGQDEDS